MEYVGIPTIIIICYLIGEIFKVCIFKKKRRNKYVPIVVGISGGILGIVTYYVSPEILMNIESPFMAVAIGIISGLASTGGYQAIKQIIKKTEEEK